MAIAIHCTCGVSFTADERFVNATIHCPNCSRAGKVPAPQADESFDPTLRREWCPNCHRVLTPSGRLCKSCDYLLKTGKPLKQRGPVMKAVGIGAGIAAVVALWIGGAFYFASVDSPDVPVVPESDIRMIADESEADESEPEPDAVSGE